MGLIESLYSVYELIPVYLITHVLFCAYTIQNMHLQVYDEVNVSVMKITSVKLCCF